MTGINISALKPTFWGSFLCLSLLSIAGGLMVPVTLAATIPTLGLFYLIGYFIKFKSAPAFSIPLGLFLTIFMGLTGLSSLWSITPHESWHRFLSVLPLMLTSYAYVALAAACPRDEILKFKPYLVGIVLGCGLLLALQLNVSLLQIPTNKNDPNAAHVFLEKSVLNKNVAFFVFLLPSMISLSRSKFRIYVLAAIAAVTAALFYATESQASQLAIMVMFVCAYGMFPFINNVTRFLIFAKLIILALLMPFIASIAFDLVDHVDMNNTIIPATGLMRLENWDFITREVLRHPWIGHGVDTTRAMTFITDKIFYPFDHIMHPHNAFLQMWVEFGLLGGIFTAASLGFYASRKPNRLHLTTFCGAIVILLLAWSMWSAWMIAGLFMTHAVIIWATKAKNDPSISSAPH